MKAKRKKWSSEAEAALKRVPFFVRKKVRDTIERQVLDRQGDEVTLTDVTAARKRFLERMADDVKGFQTDICFGPSECPHRAVACDNLIKQVEERLKRADILGFLKKSVGNELKYHHEFRVSAAECPNACSQPQIKDMGIIGAVLPGISDQPCNGCGACVTTCPDKAISLDPERNGPVIDTAKCRMCGKCIAVCPTGTIAEKKRGFRVQLGGRLGRHPRLGMELPDLLTEKQVLDVLDNSLRFYKRHSHGGERFSRLVKKEDLKEISSRSGSPGSDTNGRKKAGKTPPDMTAP